MQNRYGFIDLYRGWAVIIMIETHAVNAWMDAGYRTTEWFSFLNLLNGFVAPSFLFISGVSFSLLMNRKAEPLSRWSPELAGALKRLLIILGIGFLMHIPRIVWTEWPPRIIAEDWVTFFQIDILQTIALSLILLHIFFFLMKDQVHFFRLTSALTLIALLITPLLWEKDFFEVFHPILANLINGKHNPLFPLFPWCVFLWSGALVGSYFLRNAQEGIRTSIQIGAGGIALFIIGYIADIMPITIFSYENFWLVSPNWVLMRLGILLVLFSGFRFFEEKNMGLYKPVLFIGGQSLFVYVIHLWLIYSITGEKASIQILSQSNSVPATIVLLFITLISVYGLTRAWVNLKSRNFLIKR